MVVDLAGCEYTTDAGPTGPARVAASRPRQRPLSPYFVSTQLTIAFNSSSLIWLAELGGIGIWP